MEDGMCPLMTILLFLLAVLNHLVSVEILDLYVCFTLLVCVMRSALMTNLF